MITNARKSHYISDNNGGIAVHSYFAKDLGDNGLAGDMASSCMMAPAVDSEDVYVYITTNGDDVLLGCLDEDGEFELWDEDNDWIGITSMGWLRDILNVEFDFVAGK